MNGGRRRTGFGEDQSCVRDRKTVRFVSIKFPTVAVMVDAPRQTVLPYHISDTSSTNFVAVSTSRS